MNQQFLAMDKEVDVALALGLFVVSTKRARKERSADEQRSQGLIASQLGCPVFILDTFNI